jgi:hypothetical protein
MQILSKCVRERDVLALEGQEYSQNGQESDPMAGHWVYIDIPSKTSRYSLFCEIADCPVSKTGPSAVISQRDRVH